MESGEFTGCEFLTDAGARCVRDLGHAGDHVVCQPGSASLWYYRVKEHGLVVEAHVDLKPGSSFDYEETAALWVLLEHGRS